MLCGGSGFPFSLSEWSLTICLTPYNHRQRVLSASLNKTFLSLSFFLFFFIFLFFLFFIDECPAGDDPDARCARFDCRNPTIARTICCSTCTPPQTQRQATVPPQTTPFHRQYRQHPPLGQRFGRVFESPTFQLPPQRAIQPYPDRYSRRPSYSNSQPFQTRSPFQPSRQIQQRPYFQPTQPFQQRPRFTPNQPFRQRPPFNPSQPVGQRSSFGQYPPLQRTQRYRPPQAKPFQNMFTFPFQGNFDNSFNSFIQRFQRYSTFFKRK